MKLDDALSTLDLTRESTLADAKRAYKLLAMKHHPDRSSAPDATETMQRVTEASERQRHRP